MSSILKAAGLIEIFFFLFSFKEPELEGFYLNPAPAIQDENVREDEEEVVGVGVGRVGGRVREREIEIEKKSQFQQEIIVSNSQTRIISCYSSITLCMASFFSFFFWMDGGAAGKKEGHE